MLQVAEARFDFSQELRMTGLVSTVDCTPP
jgi:hypothetical protein